VYSQTWSLFYWKDTFINFGDYISLKLVERIVGQPIKEYNMHKDKGPKLLAIGSILTFARTHDIVWGSGANGKWLDLKHYRFTRLDIRAVRGPLTREFLRNNFNCSVPAVYGDPALLIPYFFPEFKRSPNPKYPYIIIPHYSEQKLFPKDEYENVVYPTEPWNEVIEKILNSAFVVSSSLHGLVVAEAFGIPARWLRITENEAIFKYVDYYLGSGRPEFAFARSVEEALEMGGEKPFECDLEKLYRAFPFELWPNSAFVFPQFIH
jgi:pyruvyltransferase